MDGDWQMNRLYNQLPTHIIDYITEIFICSHPNAPGCFSWNGECDGIYTAQAGYKWLMRNHTVT